MAYRISSHKAARRGNKAANSCPYGSNALIHNKKALNRGLLLYAYPKIDGNGGGEKYKRRDAVWEGDRMGFAVMG